MASPPRIFILFILHFSRREDHTRYQVSFPTKPFYDKLLAPLSFIQPVDSIDAQYAYIQSYIQRIYHDEGKSKYPKELLFLSMISIKGTPLDNLDELLHIEENKVHNKLVVDTIKREVNFKSR